MEKIKTEKIKITNGYINAVINSKVIPCIIKKQFTAKTSYWLATAFDEISAKSKIYMSERKKIIEKYAMRHEADGNIESGETWKAGDIVASGDSVSLIDVAGFSKESSELDGIEIEIGIYKIKLDLEKEPVLTIEEMTFLLPLVYVE